MLPGPQDLTSSERQHRQAWTSQLLPDPKNRGCRGYRECHRADLLGGLTHQLLPQASFPCLCSWYRSIFPSIYLSIYPSTHPSIEDCFSSTARHCVLVLHTAVMETDQRGPAFTDHTVWRSGGDRQTRRQNKNRTADDAKYKQENQGALLGMLGPDGNAVDGGRAL